VTYIYIPNFINYNILIFLNSSFLLTIYQISIYTICQSPKHNYNYKHRQTTPTYQDYFPYVIISIQSNKFNSRINSYLQEN